MKKLNKLKMSKINGGARCIYHFMIAPVLLSYGAIGGAIGWFSGNDSAVMNCWNNSHIE